jgi:hypothetical protein
LVELPQPINGRGETVTEALFMDPNNVAPWGGDWFWSLPLIVATVVIHVFGLGLIYQQASLLQARIRKNTLPYRISASIIGAAALVAAIFHGLEAAMWAATYVLLGALPDRKSAMLYSLGAMTTFGTSDIDLESRWRLMGPLESLNGWILFGLTTAFLFAFIQNIWHTSNRSA